MNKIISRVIMGAMLFSLVSVSSAIGSDKKDLRELTAEEKEGKARVERLIEILSNKDHFRYTKYASDGGANEQKVRVTVKDASELSFGEAVNRASKQISSEFSSSIKTMGDMAEQDSCLQFQFRSGRTDLFDEIVEYLLKSLKTDALRKEVKDIIYQNRAYPYGIEIFQGGIWMDGCMEILGNESIVIYIEMDGYKIPEIKKVITINWDYCHC
jgi:hypothetical protein